MSVPPGNPRKESTLLKQMIDLWLQGDSLASLAPSFVHALPEDSAARPPKAAFHSGESLESLSDLFK